MSLDLANTAQQIDRMAQDLTARQSDKNLRLRRALQAIRSFDVAEYTHKRGQSKATLAWPVPELLDDPGARYGPEPLPHDFCVVAADGSHIDVDRHVPARCFLINIGVTALTYGSRADARLYSQPRLYAREDEMALRDEGASPRRQSIEGTVLGAKRTVEEMNALVQAVRDLPPDTPTVALVDGSLIMLGLVGRGYHDFVLDLLIRDGFVRALQELRSMADDRRLAVASYISLPRGAEVVNALRLALCPDRVADCHKLCGELADGQRPCDAGAADLLDREMFLDILRPGDRSAVFASSSRLVERYYKGHEVHFFYVHAGEEIGRVEVPAWVANEDSLLRMAHSAVVDQCRRGQGYPVALMEAHEQAVVTAADRRSFAQLVEDALYDQHVPVYTSEKSRSKRLRWL